MRSHDIASRLRHLADGGTDGGPDGRGFLFLEDGENPTGPLTYRELDTGARRVAARLAGVAPGERALLVYAPGFAFLEAFFGCLYAGLIPVPLPVPRTGGCIDTLGAVAADCRAALLLNAVASRDRVDRSMAGWGPAMRAAVVRLVTDDGLPAPVPPASVAPPAPDRPAFLQYTSGSTGTPKGVIVSHGNLSANLEAIRQGFRAGPDDVGVIWLPHFHDMGLVGGILETVHLGASTVLLPPILVAARPLRWVRAISRFGGTVSGGTPFLYDRCATRTTAEARVGLNLDSWRVAFVGAEPLRRAALTRFAESFAPCGFRSRALFPCYGLAEATLYVTGGPAGEGCRSSTQAPHLADSGVPASGHDVRVVDPETRRQQPEGQTGELWVRGPSVATGYWQRPDETAEIFEARTAEGDGPFLRTGDLGHCEGRKLVVTGRMKTLIILAGRNLYAEDLVMAVAEAAPELDPSGIAAFGVDRRDLEPANADEAEALVVAVEITGRRVCLSAPSGYLSPGDAQAAPELGPLAERIRTALSRGFQVGLFDLAFLPPGRLARTSSGKTRLLASRDRYLADRFGGPPNR